MKYFSLKNSRSAEEEVHLFSLKIEIEIFPILEVKLEVKEEYWDEYLKILNIDSNVDELRWYIFDLNDTFLEVRDKLCWTLLIADKKNQLQAIKWLFSLV